MPWSLPVVRRLWRRRYLGAYLALATALLAHLRYFHHPDTGFTSLLWFGEEFAPSRLARLDPVPIHTLAGGGYDGQFYAQIAVAGNPLDPALAAALDAPAYRGRRILVPMFAHLAARGDPARTLDAYALANVVAWLVLAFLLARWWFPPRDLHNLLRWTGALFGVGMIVSMARSLVDGPALLLLAAGARAVERNRRVLGAVLLGAAGLTRETSLLAAAALLPVRAHELGGGRRAWARVGLTMAICVLPAVLWALILRAHFGFLGGARNFSLPLAGFVGKLRELRAGWHAGGLDRIQHEVLAVLSIATQVTFMLWHRRVRETWWRIGAPFSLCALILGWPVWEGTLSAAARVLLPLTLAFNVLVPRTRRGLVLLLLGNLSVLSAPFAFRPMARPPDVFADGMSAGYVTGWYDRETDDTGAHHWRWAMGGARVWLHCPCASDRTVAVDFALRSVVDRTVVLRVGEVERRIVLRAQQAVPVRLAPFTLHPGTTAMRFTTDAPPWLEPGPMRRQLTFSVHDLSVR